MEGQGHAQLVVPLHAADEPPEEPPPPRLGPGAAVPRSPAPPPVSERSGVAVWAIIRAMARQVAVADVMRTGPAPPEFPRPLARNRHGPPPPALPVSDGSCLSVVACMCALRGEALLQTEHHARAVPWLLAALRVDPLVLSPLFALVDHHLLSDGDEAALQAYLTAALAGSHAALVPTTVFGVRDVTAAEEPAAGAAAAAEGGGSLLPFSIAHLGPPLGARDATSAAPAPAAAGDTAAAPRSVSVSARFGGGGGGGASAGVGPRGATHAALPSPSASARPPAAGAPPSAAPSGVLRRIAKATATSATVSASHAWQPPPAPTASSADVQSPPAPARSLRRAPSAFASAQHGAPGGAPGGSAGRFGFGSAAAVAAAAAGAPHAAPPPAGSASSTAQFGDAAAAAEPAAAGAAPLVNSAWLAELLCARLRRYDPRPQPPESRLFNLERRLGLGSNADVAFAKAEAEYYQHDSVAALGLTRRIVAGDPRNAGYTALHCAVLLSLRLADDLFAIAHAAVAAEPRAALSWFAVGCYGLAVARRGAGASATAVIAGAAGEARAAKAKAQAGEGQ